MSRITIDPLEASVTIVHIPVHVAHLYTNQLYWTLDRAKECEFFNLTANRIEIALFASTELITSEWTPDEHVQIDGPWGVFEISSGDCEEAEGTNYDSPHLRYVSAALAEGNVSILYQSSYFTDFLLVKAEDFGRAAEIFRGRGWHVDPVVPISHARRCSHSPPSPPESPIAEITVLSSPLACIGLPLEVEERSCERLRKFLVWPTRVKDALRSSSGSSSRSRSRSRSASSGARPFISYTRTEDGISISTEIRVLKSLFDQEEELLSAAGELDDSDSESSSSSASQDHRRVSLPGTIPLQWSQSSTPTTKSYVITPVRSALSSPLRTSFAMTGMSRSSSGHSRTQSDGVRRAPLMMRRCSEGAGAHLQHWSWKSSMGLEQVESEIGRLGPALERIQQDQDCDGDSGMPTPDLKTEDPVESSRTMRCLQLDLRSLDSSTYHLDKSGLVTKFSDLLHSNGVRMLYSSTTNTANILVRGRDVLTAEALLRAPPEMDSESEAGDDNDADADVDMDGAELAT